MPTRLVRSTFLAALLLAAVATPVRADRKLYLFTYQTRTLPAGVSEIEAWYTSELSEHGGQDLVHNFQLEGEFGVTDRLSISLYAIFEKEGAAALDFKETKLEARYRLSQPGLWPVEVGLYGEYRQPANVRKFGDVEGKLLLEKDLGNFNLAANLIAERELEVKENQRENAFEWTVGTSYSVTPRVAVGAEAHGSFSDSEASVGPVLSVAFSRTWVTLSPYVGLNRRTPDYGFRTILGFGF